MRRSLGAEPNQGDSQNLATGAKLMGILDGTRGIVQGKIFGVRGRIAI